MPASSAPPPSGQPVPASASVQTQSSSSHLEPSTQDSPITAASVTLALAHAADAAAGGNSNTSAHSAEAIADQQARDELIASLHSTAANPAEHYSLMEKFRRKKLKQIFEQLDRNNDGKISAEELMHAFDAAGLKYDKARIHEFMAVVIAEHAEATAGSQSPSAAPAAAPATAPVNSSASPAESNGVAPPTVSLEGINMDQFISFVTRKEQLSRQFSPFNITQTMSPSDLDVTARRVIMFWYHGLPNPASKVAVGASPPGSTFADAVVALTAGGIAGGASRTVVAPMERLKIIFQTQPDPPKYTGIFQSLRLIWREEGLRGFFRGNGANCIRIIPQTGIQFYSYGEYKKFFSGENGEMTPYRRLVAGALAGATSQVLTYPLDMIRARITVDQTGVYDKGIVRAFKTVAKTEGPLAFYKGLLPSVVGIVPYVGLDFAVYESLKELPIVPKDSETKQPTVTAKLICGGIAGLVGQTVAYPLDLVRRRLQVQGSQPVFVGSIPTAKYSGMLDCMAKTVKAEGFVGLYKGLWPNYLKAVPAVASAFVIYEHSFEYLNSVKSSVTAPKVSAA